MLIAVVVAWIVSVIRRAEQGTEREALAKRLTRLTAVVNLVALIGWALVIGSSNRELFDFGFDRWLRVLQLLGVLGAFGTIAASWHAWVVWKERRGAYPRLWAATVAAACLGVTWFAVAFRLLAPSLNY